MRIKKSILNHYLNLIKQYFIRYGRIGFSHLVVLSMGLELHDQWQHWQKSQQAWQQLQSRHHASHPLPHTRHMTQVQTSHHQDVSNSESDSHRALFSWPPTVQLDHYQCILQGNTYHGHDDLRGHFAELWPWLKTQLLPPENAKLEFSSEDYPVVNITAWSMRLDNNASLDNPLTLSLTWEAPCY